MWLRHRRDEQARIAAVLDIGSYKCACLIARVTPPQRAVPARQPARVQLLGYSMRQSEGVSGGYVVDMNAAERCIRQAIAKAEQMADAAIDKLYVTAAGGQFGSDSLTAKVAVSSGIIQERHVDEALAAAREHAARGGKIPLHMRAAGFAIGSENDIRDPRGMAGDVLTVDVHSILIERLPLTNLRLCLDRSHLRMAGFAAPAFVSGLAAMTAPEAENGAIVLDMGAGVTSLAAFAGGEMVYAASLAVGGQHITRDLAKVFNLTLGEAERLKTLYGSVFHETAEAQAVILMPAMGEDASERWLSLSKPEVCAIIRRRQEAIFSTLAEKLEKAGLPPEAGQSVVLTGGASQLMGAGPLAERVFARPARLGSPPPFFGGPSPNMGPVFSAAAGFLTYLHEEDWGYEPPSPAQGGEKSSATYLSRVGDWLWSGF